MPFERRTWQLDLRRRGEIADAHVEEGRQGCAGGGDEGGGRRHGD